ncbi:MAG: hypothetical protein QOK05_373 [Chloroflexota bacterium]|jgi:hypothetical protein|nr:hypothetical protein [Chloroflexota bacterium]
MEGIQGMMLTILAVVLGGWLLAGLVAGLMYSLGGPRLTSARQGWRY